MYFPWNVICPPAVRRDSWHYLFQKWEWSFPWFTSFTVSAGTQGSLPSDPPSLGMFSCLRKPPISERAPQSATYSTWKLNFPSKAEYLWSTHSPCYTCVGPKMQEVAVLGGLDFNISRGSMPPNPPSSSRLPALGSLFLNFLDLPLILCVFARGHLTFFTNIPIPGDETLTKAWQMLNCGKQWAVEYMTENLRFFVKREMPFLLAVKRETDDFFFVKCDQYPPPPPLTTLYVYPHFHLHPRSLLCTGNLRPCVSLPAVLFQ